MDYERVEREMEAAIQSLRSCYHHTCGGLTTMQKRAIVIALLDPWRFPIHASDCSVCGDARSEDVLLSDGSTLYEAFVAFRQSVSPGGKLARFLGIPLAFGFFGVCASPLLLLMRPEKANLTDAAVAAGIIGLAAGAFLSHSVFVQLRRAGFFWRQT